MTGFAVSTSGIALAVAGILGAAPAQAQVPDPAPVAASPPIAASGGAGIADIVVTANRRSEGAQNVAVSVTALNSERLREQNITTAQDLLGKVPSVVVTANGTQRSAETITIRGQGQTYLGPVGVVNYFAEVPLIQGAIIANQGGPGTFFDLESLQVLRGPQGTLFGKNTTGGAVLLTPKKPTNSFGGYIQAQVGNYNDREFDGALNIPIVADHLMVRIAGKKVDRDGFTKDVGPQAFGYSTVCQGPASCLTPAGRGPGFAGKDYDDRHYWTGRIGITWKPTDGIENYLLAFISRSHDNGTGTVIGAIRSDRPNLASLAANLYVPPVPNFANTFSPTIAQAIVAQQRVLGPRRIALNTDQFDRLSTWGLIDTFSAQLGDMLTFRNIVGYQRMKQNYAWDLDGTIIPVLSQTPGVGTPAAAAAGFGQAGQPTQVSNLSQITEEPQILGKALGDKLNFIFGGFYSRVRPEGVEATGSLNVGAYNPGTYFSITTRSVGIYTQASLDLGAFSDSLDGLKITGGVRHSWDEFSGKRFAANYVILPTGSASDKSQATTWTIGVDYRAMRNLLLYAKATRGYKAGGFNYASPSPTGITFGPEKVTSYEIGLKSDFHVGGMPVRFNLAAYDSEYSGIQRATADNIANGCTLPVAQRPAQCAIAGNTTGLDQGASIFNAGTGRIRGIEAETVIRPFKGLELSANYAYMDGRYKKFFLNVGADPIVRTRDTCAGPVAVPVPGSGTPPVRIDLSCIPFANTPKHQFALNARYSFDLPGALGNISAAANYSWVDKAYQAAAFTPNDDPFATRPSYGLLNLSLEWNNIEGTGVDARAFVTNATNKLYEISAPLGYSSATSSPAAIYGEPRMYGLSLRWQFGS